MAAAGPIWALHGFYLITTGLMLVLYLRHARSVPEPAVSPDKENPLEYDLPDPLGTELVGTIRDRG